EAARAKSAVSAPPASAAVLPGAAVTGVPERAAKPPRRKSRLWLAIGLPILVLVLAAAAVSAYAWTNYEDKIRQVFGWEISNDFVGTGNGEEVIVTVNNGDIGPDIARSLHDAGVTMSFDAFYDLLLVQDTDPEFFPGNYALQGKMSAQSALDALLDPANKVTDRLLITEGTILPDALEIIAQTTGIALADLQAASEDLAYFGLPAEAPSLEGYLFPATYQIEGGQDAYAVLDMMVQTMYEKLDAAGVAEADRFRILTMAALVQREAGPNTDDFYKIARVFYNRLDRGILLQSDATVAYGTGNLHTVWTTDAERADAGNLYNTYANPGLPIGPIGLPGELAIDAALNPAAGDWLFFVPINLATGETVFNTTVEDHEAAAQQLRDWCAASDENGSYC
ncbi:MAG: endolytic transglycosylase MltG, partial [Rhodoglobus sp.]